MDRSRTFSFNFPPCSPDCHKVRYEEEPSSMKVYCLKASLLSRRSSALSIDLHAK